MITPALRHFAMPRPVVPSPACAPNTVPVPHRLGRLIDIGRSLEGRPLVAHLRGRADAPLRVLVVAGQHGDEPTSVAAADALASMPSACLDESLHLSLHLAVVARANPDGLHAETRHHAADLDLNRDHLLLDAPETQALHAFVRGWQPHLVIDLHTYPARRSALLQHGLVHGADVLFETATAPAARTTLDATVTASLTDSLLRRLRQAGLHGGPYVVVSGSGRLRRGTPDGVDLRNGLALRYGVPTLLLEGRRPSKRVPGATHARTLSALRVTLRAALDWAVVHRDTLTRSRPLPQAGDAVPLWTRYRRAPTGSPQRACWLPMQYDGRPRVLPTMLPGRYTPRLAVTRATTLPAAYAVPKTLTPVLDVLRRNGFVLARGRDPVMAEEASVLALKRSSRPRRAPRQIALRRAERRIVLSDYVTATTAQPGGHLLAVLLEPASKYGLARLLPDALPLAVGHPYPILRLP
ncbi:MAG: hypothetical protein AAFQ53_03980 [Bacteroidota bacterium]